MTKPIKSYFLPKYIVSTEACILQQNDVCFGSMVMKIDFE